MVEQQEARPTARRRVQKLGFMLCLLLVIVGILFDVVMMYSQRWYDSAVPVYISTWFFASQSSSDCSHF